MDFKYLRFLTEVDPLLQYRVKHRQVLNSACELMETAKSRNNLVVKFTFAWVNFRIRLISLRQTIHERNELEKNCVRVYGESWRILLTLPEKTLMLLNGYYIFSDDKPELNEELSTSILNTDYMRPKAHMTFLKKKVSGGDLSLYQYHKKCDSLKPLLNDEIFPVVVNYPWTAETLGVDLNDMLFKGTW